MLYTWFERNSGGDPCLVMPTGSGKSWVIADLCRDAIQQWPETRILMLTHVRELIQQNAEKMRIVWPNAPLGIYSAGIGRRELDEPITFAGIQSVRNRADDIGHIDLCLIDECHLVSNEQQGGYRALIHRLRQYNPRMRVIGLTASPFRLGQGCLTEGDDALFTDLIEPVSIEELIHKGYLAPLQSKNTRTHFDLSGVHKRGGEFIAGELERAVDVLETNQAVVREIIERAGDRKAWLIFCAGVEHSLHVRDALREQGISAETVTGKTPKGERDRIISAFRRGEIRALTNANVLTTGFDYPDIDLIAMLRPTLSPTLYIQMAGRGLRPKSHTDHCLVLDFAGNVSVHGPITNVRPPQKKGDGDAPVKACPECDELVMLSAKVCPSCGHEFVVEADERKWKLHHDDIMCSDGDSMAVTGWSWRRHVSRTSGKEMICVTYYGDLSDQPITEYLTILHDGYAGRKAVSTMAAIARQCGAMMAIRDLPLEDINGICDAMNRHRAPSAVKYEKDGKYYRVKHREWLEAASAVAG